MPQQLTSSCSRSWRAQPESGTRRVPRRSRVRHRPAAPSRDAFDHHRCTDCAPLRSALERGRDRVDRALSHHAPPSPATRVATIQSSTWPRRSSRWSRSTNPRASRGLALRPRRSGPPPRHRRPPSRASTARRQRTRHLATLNDFAKAKRAPPRCARRTFVTARTAASRPPGSAHRDQPDRHRDHPGGDDDHWDREVVTGSFIIRLTLVASSA
jgi:hypothetical protein